MAAVYNPQGGSSPETALYGVLKYSSQNIGDEIQSIAAMRFLPKIDYYCHRERLDAFHPGESRAESKVKLIMNAWWMWQPRHFPPSEYIDPLLISMHLRHGELESFARPEVLEYLRMHGPVGCRDMSTQRFLAEHDVPAYFSGCLTLTLQGNPEFRRKKGNDWVLCVDLPENMVREIKKRTERPVFSVSRMLSAAFTSDSGRMELAKIMLALYHNAHCVVTPRLHVALPCTAFGTPVCVIKTGSRNGRFDGMTDFFNEFGKKEFIENPKIYNFDNPPENPCRHLEMRENLIARCKEFTGYDNPAPIFDSGWEPLIALINLLHADYKADRNVINKMLYFAAKDEMADVLYKKSSLKYSKFDCPF
ncbi:MAG: polysaccharide pyruvyl transferase family protein [Clostridiales bacterium]|nr:polysaccharide pyruvyl transferase family protein [Clostridiales bacterium]